MENQKKHEADSLIYRWITNWVFTPKTENQKNHKTSHISISFSIIITFDRLILYSLPIKPNFAQTTSSNSDILIIRVHISCI